MTEIVEHGGNIFCLAKTKSESSEQFYERMWLFINNVDKYTTKHEKLIVLTKIWSNVKYLNCKYDLNIMAEVKQLKLFK